MINDRALQQPPRAGWFLLLALALGFLGGIVGSTMVHRSGGGEASLLGSSGGGPITSRTGEAGMGEPVVAVVAGASPAVVSVIVSKDLPRVEDVLFGPSPFRFRVRRPTGDVDRQEVGGGSGFIVDADGLIMTNKHVTSEANAHYDVILSTGERVAATVAARDPVLDLAILNIDKHGLPTIPLGNADELRVGQTVVAIGNALGEFRNTVSVGVVSGLGRQVRAGDRATGDVALLDHVIQTDAAINVGNSGGPLLDLAGRAVGVNTAVAGGAENIGFAIPINEAIRALEDFRTQGKIVRPVLGVRHVPITPAVQSALRLPVDAGALIVTGESSNEPAVIPGSPAARAGLQDGDMILEVDGVPITVDRPLQSFVRAKRPGDTLRLTVLSGGERKTVTVTLTEAL